MGGEGRTEGLFMGGVWRKHARPEMDYRSHARASLCARNAAGLDAARRGHRPRGPRPDAGAARNHAERRSRGGQTRPDDAGRTVFETRGRFAEGNDFYAGDIDWKVVA